MKAFCRRFLGAALLGIQVFLPLAHEWGSAIEEAEHHPWGASPRDQALGSPERGRPHHHHQAETCRLCPFLGGARVASPAPALAVSPQKQAAFSPRAERAGASSRRVAPARGPPSA